jgi:preprotein translocase subunit SecY
LESEAFTRARFLTNPVNLNFFTCHFVVLIQSEVFSEVGSKIFDHFKDSSTIHIHVQVIVVIIIVVVVIVVVIIVVIVVDVDVLVDEHDAVDQQQKEAGSNRKQIRQSPKPVAF